MKMLLKVRVCCLVVLSCIYMGIDRFTVALRANAVRGLANYLMMENSQKDASFQSSQRKFVASEVQSIKDFDNKGK